MSQQASDVSSRLWSLFTRGPLLSAGTEGRVYEVRENSSNQKFIVKMLHDAGDVKELENLMHKNHPNIVHMHRWFLESGRAHMVMEFCAGGDLFTAYRKLHAPSQVWCAAVFKQILHGIAYLHNVCRESHNDIKPENILLDCEVINPMFVPGVKIGDLGLTAPRGSLKPPGGGDPRYRAPETWHREPYSARTDVWSLGVLLFELLSNGKLIWDYSQNVKGWRMFSSNTQRCKQFLAIARSVPPWPVKTSNISGTCAQGVLNMLLCLDADQRPSVRRVLQHHWVNADLPVPGTHTELCPGPEYSATRPCESGLKEEYGGAAAPPFAHGGAAAPPFVLPLSQSVGSLQYRESRTQRFDSQSWLCSRLEFRAPPRSQSVTPQQQFDMRNQQIDLQGSLASDSPLKDFLVSARRDGRKRRLAGLPGSFMEGPVPAGIFEFPTPQSLSTHGLRRCQSFA